VLEMINEEARELANFAEVSAVEVSA